MRDALNKELTAEENLLLKKFETLSKLEEDGRLLGTRFYTDEGVKITPKESIEFVTSVTKEHIKLLERSKDIPLVEGQSPTSLL